MHSVKLLQDIIETIRSAKFFTTMADFTTDLITKMRWFLSVEINEETFEVKSRDAFLRFEIMKACKADATVRKIVNVLFTRFGLDGSFLMGQCYDGASRKVRKRT